jgi:hypothetical protein
VAGSPGQWHDVRSANIALFDSLDADAWARKGIASGYPVTVRALAYIIAGHERHHIGVIASAISRKGLHRTFRL